MNILLYSLCQVFAVKQGGIVNQSQRRGIIIFLKNPAAGFSFQLNGWQIEKWMDSEMNENNHVLLYLLRSTMYLWTLSKAR